jgi:hypothetical protein
LRCLGLATQLEQVLLALIQNAEHATADQPTPRLWVQALQSRGGRLQIMVRDNGPGVPAGLERKIFLPFFSAREDGHGVGVCAELLNSREFQSGGRRACRTWCAAGVNFRHSRIFRKTFARFLTTVGTSVGRFAISTGKPEFVAAGQPLPRGPGARAPDLPWRETCTAPC